MKVYLVLLALVLMSCATPNTTNTHNPGNPIASSSQALGKEEAHIAIQVVVDQHSLGTVVMKGGIREIPADNSATADFEIIQPPPNWLGGKGTATFSHYTDGRWFLTRVQLNMSNADVTHLYDWNVSVNAR